MGTRYEACPEDSCDNDCFSFSFSCLCIGWIKKDIEYIQFEFPNHTLIATVGYPHFIGGLAMNIKNS